MINTPHSAQIHIDMIRSALASAPALLLWRTSDDDRKCLAHRFKQNNESLLGEDPCDEPAFWVLGIPTPLGYGETVVCKDHLDEFLTLAEGHLGEADWSP